MRSPQQKHLRAPQPAPFDKLRVTGLWIAPRVRGANSRVCIFIFSAIKKRQDRRATMQKRTSPEAGALWCCCVGAFRRYYNVTLQLRIPLLNARTLEPTALGERFSVRAATE
jgi:hypothetical protein